jgi:hypothetical protein
MKRSGIPQSGKGKRKTEKGDEANWEVKNSFSLLGFLVKS